MSSGAGTRVYTTLLVALAGLTGYEVFTAAADGLTVLRCFDVYWGGGLIQPATHLIGSAGQTIFECEPVEDPANPLLATNSTHWQWQGRQAINPGATFAVQSNGQAVDVTLTGYVLR